MSSTLSKKKKEINLSGANLKAFDLNESNFDATSIILDQNEVSDFSKLLAVKSLEKLSVARNGLASMAQFGVLVRLKELDLTCNRITSIEGISSLLYLKRLCLASNSIKVIENLKNNVFLHYLDVSGNQIEKFGDLSSLVHLKTLLFHGNQVISIKNVARCLPPSLQTLTIAENQLSDLTEVQLLSSLPFLEALTLCGNPFACDAMGQYVDYRPYAICCCKNLQNLDGSWISQADRHRANVFEAEGHLKMLQPGQHFQLKQYLLEASPGYSPAFSQMPKKSVRRSSAGVNTSLLESESIHLPLMYDSPPRNKQSISEGLRPETATPLTNSEIISWQSLVYDEKQSSSPNETGRNRTSRLANGIVAPLPSELSPQRSLEFDATAHHADAHRKTPGSDRHGNVAMEITNEEADAGSVFRAKVHIEEIRAESKSDSMVYGKSALVERIGSHEVDLNRGRSIARSSPVLQMESIQSSVSLTADEAANLLHLAAAMIQAAIRGFLQRRRFQRLFKRHKAATRIQAAWRGYSARVLNLRAISIRNELKVHGLNSKISFLERKVDRVQKERKRDKALVSDTIKILIHEINMQRGQIIEIEAVRRKETVAKNQLKEFCLGLQDEISHLRTEIRNGKASRNQTSITNHGNEAKSMERVVDFEVERPAAAGTEGSALKEEKTDRDPSRGVGYSLCEAVPRIGDESEAPGNGQRHHDWEKARRKQEDNGVVVLSRSGRSCAIEDSVGIRIENDACVPKKVNAENLEYTCLENAPRVSDANAETRMVKKEVRPSFVGATSSCGSDGVFGKQVIGGRRRGGSGREGRDRNDGKDEIEDGKKSFLNRTFVFEGKNRADVKVFVDDLVEKNSLTASRIVPTVERNQHVDVDDASGGNASLQDTSSTLRPDTRDSRSSKDGSFEVQGDEVTASADIIGMNCAASRKHDTEVVDCGAEEALEDKSDSSVSISTRRSATPIQQHGQSSPREPGYSEETVGDTKSSISSIGMEPVKCSEMHMPRDPMGSEVGPYNLPKYNNVSKRRRTLFPKVLPEEYGTDKQTKNANCSADSKSEHRPMFFSPLLEPYETLDGVDVGKKVPGKDRVEHSNPEGTDVDISSHDRDNDRAGDIKSVYKEVSAYHGFLSKEKSASMPNTKGDGERHTDRRSEEVCNDYQTNVSQQTTALSDVGRDQSSERKAQVPGNTRKLDIAEETGRDTKVAGSLPLVFPGKPDRFLRSSSIEKDVCTDESDEYCNTNDRERKGNIASNTTSEEGAFENVTAVAVDDSILRHTRTSTPVMSAKDTQATQQCQDSTKDVKSGTAKQSANSPFSDVPDCLYNMPKIVPIVQRNDNETSVGLPMFIDQSFDSADDSFNG